MESRSISRVKSVYSGSDCFFGVRKHRKMRAISRQLSIMVSKRKARENLEQLEGSLCLILQGETKIIKDLKDKRICSKRALRTSQCGAFHRDSEGPHPGPGESCNGYISQQNLSRSVDEDDISAIEPSFYPHRETCNNAVRERSAEKIETLFGPGR